MVGPAFGMLFSNPVTFSGLGHHVSDHASRGSELFEPGVFGLTISRHGCNHDLFDRRPLTFGTELNLSRRGLPNRHLVVGSALEHLT